MREESGQATVEWVGLLLVAALALGALAAAAAGMAPEQDRELGATLASRLAGPSVGEPTGQATSRPSAQGATLPAVAPPVPARRPARAIRAAPAKAVDAFRSLRGLGRVSNRIWIVCLGYRRYVYEREHPRAPLAPMPVEEALDVANTCLNPLNFFGDD